MKRYLKKIVFCSSYKTDFAEKNFEKLKVKSIIVKPEEIDKDSDGILYLADTEENLRILKGYHLPAAAWRHADNQDQNLAAAFYALESLEELDEDFFERVYRREKGIPWEILETARCIVREMQPKDAEAFEEIYRDQVVSRYMNDFHNDAEGEAAYIREYQQQYRFFEYGVWSIVLKETGQVIGRAGFSEYEKKPVIQEPFQGTEQIIEDEEGAKGTREGSSKRVYMKWGDPEKEDVFCQLGYVIGAPWQRQGLAYEVCKAILTYGREEVGLENVILCMEADNQASYALGRKLGFQDCDSGE